MSKDFFPVLFIIFGSLFLGTGIMLSSSFFIFIGLILIVSGIAGIIKYKQEITEIHRKAEEEKRLEIARKEAEHKKEMEQLRRREQEEKRKLQEQKNTPQPLPISQPPAPTNSISINASAVPQKPKTTYLVPYAAEEIEKVGDPYMGFHRNYNLADEHRQDFTAIDIETTGLSTVKDYIIEIAAVRYRNGKETAFFSSLIKPPIPIPFTATEINHISNEMVIDAPDTETVMEQFLEFLGEDMMVGHNIEDFDMPFLKRFAYLSNGYSDTYKMSKYIYLDTENKKLDTLCKHFEIKKDTSHRALSDCRAAAQLYLKLSEITYDEEHSFTFSLASGTKAFQNNIENLCHIGDKLEYAYDNTKEKYECLINGTSIGYVPAAKNKTFKYNLPITKSITIIGISETSSNKKTVEVKVSLSEKQRTERKENLRLLSSKAMCQKNIANAAVGEDVIFKVNDTGKITFYISKTPNDEIGYVSQKEMFKVERVLDYSAKITGITIADNGKYVVTIRMEYCRAT